MVTAPLMVIVAVIVVATGVVFVKTTVAVTVVPGNALAGKATVTLASVSKTVITALRVLLLRSGSKTPGGGVTVAVLVIAPLAVDATLT